MNHLSLGRLGLCCLLCCGCLSCAILKTSLQPLQSPIIPKLSMFRPPISPLFIQGRVSIPNCLDTNTTYQPASNLIPWDCNCTASIEYWRGRGGGGGRGGGQHLSQPYHDRRGHHGLHQGWSIHCHGLLNTFNYVHECSLTKDCHSEIL